MIIGCGDIASVLEDRDRPDRIYFAAGVSNSSETREKEYGREMILLEDQDTSKHLVYFSSLCVFYSKTRYANHKKAMEIMVKSRFRVYTIIRLGNITWGTNKNTIINFLRERLEKSEEMLIQDTYRYIITKTEFLHWIDLIPDWDCEINIPGQMLSVRDILSQIIFGRL